MDHIVQVSDYQEEQFFVCYISMDSQPNNMCIGEIVV